MPLKLSYLHWCHLLILQKCGLHCQNKNNRWLFRYDVNRKRPTIQFAVAIDDYRKKELERAGLEVQNNGQVFLDKPEHIYRAVGILKDCLDYCSNDDNFKRASNS